MPEALTYLFCGLLCALFLHTQTLRTVKLKQVSWEARRYLISRVEQRDNQGLPSQTVLFSYC